MPVDDIEGQFIAMSAALKVTAERVRVMVTHGMTLEAAWDMLSSELVTSACCATNPQRQMVRLLTVAVVKWACRDIDGVDMPR